MSADRFDAEYTGFSGRSLAETGCGSWSYGPDDRRADHRARGSRVTEGPRGSACPMAEYPGAPQRDRAFLTQREMLRTITDFLAKQAVAHFVRILGLPTCVCRHSALMHDSGGGCSLCPCRGFRG